MFCDKMSSLMDTDFSDWLSSEMNKRGWTQSDLARASGLNRQSISDYVNRRRSNPEPEALISLSQAFKLSPITVFRKAGLLPSEGSDQVSFEDWQHLISQLTNEEQEEMREIIALKIERRKKSEQSARAAKFKPEKA